MKNELVGLIPAAGKGVRLYPKTKKVPKVLLSMGDSNILKRTIEIMRDQLNIKKIFIIVNYGKDQITDYFGDGSNFGVDITYITNNDVEKGLAHGILLAEKYIKSTFCVMLGDELYYDPNHSELLEFLERDFTAVCGVMETHHSNLIRKNYSVELQNEKIVSLTEKPEIIHNNLMGCGTYLFSTKIFDYLRKIHPSKKTRKTEIADAINMAAKDGEIVHPFFLTGHYVNVNSIDDFNLACCISRSHDMKKKRISLIIPAYNEEESIQYVIEDFKDKVDELLIINNNSSDKTVEIAEKHGIKAITGSFGGYGEALKYGMDQANGDIFILTEADGSFTSSDLGKILEYLKSADMVLGTRTTKQMLDPDANMKTIVKWGNILVAKMIEALWWGSSTPRLTDVGCTYRGIWKDSYDKIKDHLKSPGPEFSPEMIIEGINSKLRIIEIPVTYEERVGGVSKLSKNIYATARTGLCMLKLIIHKKFKTIFN